MQRLDVAVRVQPLVLNLGAQCLGVATSDIASLGDRRHPAIEAGASSSSSSARCDRSCKQVVTVFVIVFVIVLVIVLWDRTR